MGKRIGTGGYTHDLEGRSEEEVKAFLKEGIKKTPTTIEAVHAILQQAMDEVGDRATLYDKPQGEESMPTVVKMFNTLYQTGLTVEQGWMFMTILKQVRSSNGDFKLDNYVDLAAYSAFAGKAAQDLT